ncbi:MAG: hypothetical protein ABIO79_06205, partial [Ferruginibacter sp.]
MCSITQSVTAVQTIAQSKLPTANCQLPTANRFAYAKKFNKIFIVMMAVMLLGVGSSWGQVNYVSWDFTTALSSGDYGNTINQNSVRTTALTNATLSTISLNGTGIAITAATTFHRSTGWPTAASLDITKYLEYSITLTNGYTYQNATLTLAMSVQTSSATSAPTKLQIRYAYDANSFADAGIAQTIGQTTTNPSLTIPAPGNTTSTILKVRIYCYSSSTSTGNFRILTSALTAASAPIAPASATNYYLKSGGIISTLA